MEQVETWKRDHPLIVREPENGEIMPEWAINKIWEVTTGDAVVCTEVGQHQMWAAQHYLCRHPRRFISSGGLGTMGFGFPAAIGAQVAVPGPVGDRHRRRRLLPDDPPGAGHRGPVRTAGEGVHHQQPVSGHGAAVAGALLEPALQPYLHGVPARLRQAGRGVRGGGLPGRAGRRTWKRCCGWPSPATARPSSISGSSGRPTSTP